MLNVGPLICILLLAFLCRLVYLGTQMLSKVAFSVAAINSQMLAFIEGGATPDEESPTVDHFKNHLTPSHLEFWSYLGQRFYANHASWLAENKRKEDS